MSRFMKVMIALLAVTVLATPAMAELKLNGYFRTQMIAQQLSDSVDDTASLVDQRLRVKMTYDINEFIKFVNYTEVDTPWGQASKGDIGGGGKVGADGVNIETKNVYLDIKVPNSDIKARIGVQGYSLGFGYSIVGNDMSGISIGTKLSDAAGINFAYFKFNEGADTLQWDDTDLYAVKLDFKVNETTKLGAAVAFFDNNVADTTTDDAEVIILGLKGSTQLDALGLSGAFAYSTGSNGTEDLSGYMATAKVTAKAGTTKIGARLLFYSSDDDSTDGDNNAFIGDVSNGAYEWYNEGSEIFLASKSYNNSGSPRKALVDAAYAGYGLLGLVVKADMKYDNGLYSMLSAGYYTALEDSITGMAAKDDKDLGYEVVAKIGTKIAEKADLSLTGAYAGLGDFYNGVANDSLYKVNMMLNVSF